jgi:hypothetical protein
MRREARSSSSLLAAAVLFTASCAGGADPPSAPSPGVTATTGAAVTTMEPSTAPSIESLTEPSIEPSTSSSAAPASIDQITIAESNPDAIIAVGDTLMQTDRIVVLLESGSPRSAAEAVAVALGGEIIGELGYIDLYQISVPGGDESSVRAAIELATPMPEVEHAYSDGMMEISEEIWGIRTSPLDDPVYQGETGDGYRAIGVDRAWQYIKGSGIEPWGVKVGITDTRLWTGTDEFDTSKIKSLDPARDESADRLEWKAPEGWQAEGRFELPDGSHGTAVATIVGADADDGGAAGVASILGDRLELTYSNVLDENIAQFSRSTPDPSDPTKYTSSSGRTWSVKGLEGLLNQVKAGAKVINMSWGCQSTAPPPPPVDPNAPAQKDCGTDVADAYRRFFSKMAMDHPDVVFVAAAGNDNFEPDGTRTYPGGFGFANVITVGNVNNDGSTNASSNRTSPNFEVTIAAPGNEAVRGLDADGKVVDDTTLVATATSDTDGRRGGFSSGGGTSMAAPQVTAAIALMKSLDPTLTAAEIKQILKETARAGVPADPEATTYLPTPIDQKVGAGLLAVDEAVLAVVNRVRKDNGLDPIDGQQLVQFGVVDAVAITGAPDEYTVRAIVTGCRGECTAVSISVSGDHSLGGPTTQNLSGPGDVTWSLTVTDDYPVGIVVKRLDNGAGSRILLDHVPIAGTWNGTFTLTEAIVPEGQTLPDGTPADAGSYSGDELENCIAGAGAAVGEAVEDAIQQLKDGFPFTVIFTGDYEQPGTATIKIAENDDATTPWSVGGSSVVFQWVDDGAVISFSGTVTGATMTGAWGAIQADLTELRGVFSITKAGD